MENMEKVVYLDNAATTPCAPEALEMMVKALSGACGNPSSHYSVGYEAKEFVDTGRAQVAKAINASPAELFFTSCGSEADNWAIKGTAYALMKKGKKHIISTAFEHHAVLHTCEYLEKRGFEVTYLDVDENGTVKLPDPYAVVCRSRPAGWDTVKPAESMPIMTDWKERFIEAYDIEFCKWVESVHAGKLTGPSSWDGYVACVAGDALNASRGTSQFLKVETMEKPEMYK